MLSFVPVGVLNMFAVSPERRNMGLYEVSLYMSLLDFGMGTMLANFHMWYNVGVKSSFQHAREECESKRAYVF